MYSTIFDFSTNKNIKTNSKKGIALIKNYQYDNIINPETKRKVKINSEKGKKILKQYGGLAHGFIDIMNSIKTLREAFAIEASYYIMKKLDPNITVKTCHSCQNNNEDIDNRSIDELLNCDKACCVLNKIVHELLKNI